VKNLTMKDIALRLDVSTVTVSKALSDREGVSKELKDKIKKAADELGYRYNAAAKAIKDGISCNIGIIVSERFIHEGAFYSKMYQSVIKKLSDVNYFGLLEIVTDENEENCIVPNIIQNNKVDGTIVLGQMSRKYVEMIEKYNLPFLFLDFYNEDYTADSIIGDSIYGTYVLTNYLIEKGHRKIGFVGSVLLTSSILDRYIGFYKALVQNQLPQHKEWIIEDRDKKGNFIEFALPDKMPTAFVCNCDEVAYQFIKRLNKEGYMVPNDISVVGFDNYIYSTLTNPKLTTFESNIDNMTENAVEAIIRKVRDKNYILGRKVISGKLVIRDSVRDIS
jgi:LacI family transcriptional regulator